MEEYQRQKAIEEATKKIKELEQLNDKYDELEKQKQNPAVKAYLKLLKDISLLEEKYKYIQNEEDIIKDAFFNFFKEHECTHPIWMYTSSEYINKEIFSYNDLGGLLVSELSENCETSDTFVFEYNEYVCLECGKRERIKNWERFEQEHFVLKNQYAFINEPYYINLYYQLLYTKSVKEAQKLVIEKFEKNKQASKTKVLKKEDN